MEERACRPLGRCRGRPVVHAVPPPARFEPTKTKQTPRNNTIQKQAQHMVPKRQQNIARKTPTSSIRPSSPCSPRRVFELSPVGRRIPPHNPTPLTPPQTSAFHSKRLEGQKLRTPCTVSCCTVRHKARKPSDQIIAGRPENDCFPFLDAFNSTPSRQKSLDLPQLTTNFISFYGSSVVSN